MEMVTRAEYERRELEERIAAAEAELKLYKAGLVGIPVNGAEPVTPVPAPPTTKPKVKVVNRNQQVYTRGMNPKPEYSRVVSVRFTVAAGSPIELAMVPTFGDRVWVLKISVCLKAALTNQANQNYLQFRIGGTGDASAQQVLGWENLLPLMDQDGALNWWVFCDGCICFERTMKRFYDRDNRRLAVIGYRTGAGSALIQTSFEISEG